MNIRIQYPLLLLKELLYAICVIIVPKRAFDHIFNSVLLAKRALLV